jgi:hypothetical protein
VAIAVAVGSLVAVAALDFVLEPHISMMFFYLLPVTLAVILTGNKGGIACSIGASVLSFVDHLLLAGHASTGILIWNASMRLGTLLVVCGLVNYWWTARQDAIRNA